MESIITDNLESCYFCGKGGVIQMHHCLSGSYRKLADKEGLIVPLCLRCHTLVHSSGGTVMKKYLQKKAQEVWEEQNPNRDFLKTFGRNFR